MPRVVYQQVRDGIGGTFFELGFVQNTGSVRGGVECRQHGPGAVAALFGFARDDAGNVGRRAGKEVSGHFHMHLAGNRRQMSAESCRDCDSHPRRPTPEWDRDNSSMSVECP